jgi:hypothetical protein
VRAAQSTGFSPGGEQHADSALPAFNKWRFYHKRAARILPVYYLTNVFAVSGLNECSPYRGLRYAWDLSIVQGPFSDTTIAVHSLPKPTLPLGAN